MIFKTIQLMNLTRNQLITLFLSLVLLGCNEIKDKTVTVIPKSKQAILLDSLQKLDSIVLKYIAKNAAESMEYAKQAGKLAQVINTPKARAKAYNILGNAFSVINIDSGFYFYHKAVVVSDSFNLTDIKGKALYNLGMLNRLTGNEQNCIMFLDSALRFSVSANDFATMSNSLNTIGGFYYRIGEKGIARKMFDSAYAVAKNNSLYLPMGSAMGNLARFETDRKKSIALSKLAISYLERSNSSDVPIAKILINIGYRCTETDSAIWYYNQAVNMVSADCAPDVIIGAYNNMAYCYLDKGDFKNAEICIGQYALPVAIRTNNIDWQSTVYDTYGDILEGKGKLNEAKAMKQKSIALRKSYRESVSASLNSMKINSRRITYEK